MLDHAPDPSVQRYIAIVLHIANTKGSDAVTEAAKAWFVLFLRWRYSTTHLFSQCLPCSWQPLPRRFQQHNKDWLHARCTAYLRGYILLSASCLWPEFGHICGTLYGWGYQSKTPSREYAWLCRRRQICNFGRLARNECYSIELCLVGFGIARIAIQVKHATGLYGWSVSLFLVLAK